MIACIQALRHHVQCQASYSVSHTAMGLWSSVYVSGKESLKPCSYKLVEHHGSSSSSICLSLCVPNPTSCHLSIRAPSSPNFVASRFQMPLQCLTVGYVPVTLKKGCLIKIRLHPCLPVCLLPSVFISFFANLLSVF